MDVKPEGIQTGQPPVKTVFDPWELKAGFNRDREPHRAGLLTGLALFTTVATWFYVTIFPLLLIVPARVLDHKSTRRDPVGISYCLLCLMPPLTAIVSALITRSLAARDLERIRTSDMDPRGQYETEKAWSRARICFWACILGPFGWVILGFLLYIGLLAVLPPFGPGGP
jgi:hypothetical protein